MIEASYFHEKEKLESLPKEVQQVIQNILIVLDTEYGTDRNKYEDDGGYVLVLENPNDLREIQNTRHIDCNHVIPEYVDKIVCNNGTTYTNSLILCNNDYAISLIIPIELTPLHLANYMTD
jgi:hypothetical protein